MADEPEGGDGRESHGPVFHKHSKRGRGGVSVTVQGIGAWEGPKGLRVGGTWVVTKHGESARKQSSGKKDKKKRDTSGRGGT